MNDKKHHRQSDETLWSFEELSFQESTDSREADPPPASALAGESFSEVPQDVFSRIEADAHRVGGEWEEPEHYRGSIGRTMFDTSASEDNSVTVLLPRENIEKVPAQSLLRIHSWPDDRYYLGVVIKGPFAEPDGIRGDAPIVVTTTVKGAIFMPKFHGRVQVELLGEELDGKGGPLTPPRFRPLPNSPVFALDSTETARVLKTEGEILLGLAVGHEDLEVKIPANRKSVWSRHVGILGTTGGGKSTTVSGLVSHFQKAGMATILIDTEGEYTMINEATADPTMCATLQRRKMSPSGVANSSLYYLVGRETTNPHHPHRQSFSLTFDQLSPYLVGELLELNDAQEQRYLKAYDIAKLVLKDLKISPTPDEKQDRFFELDEMEEGYPRMRLAHMYDIIQACAHIVDKSEDSIQFSDPDFKEKRRDVVVASIKKFSDSMPGHVPSWRALQGKLGRIKRLNIFDRDSSQQLRYKELLQPGRVTIIDLSDTDSPRINNLVIAELLRGVQKCQDELYAQAEKDQKQPTPVMVVIEEAHEFLSAERVRQMPVLFQQVARIARRGRKRWLGLTFVTQLPQHLPDEVLGLINNFVLHKISDAGVISRLKRSIGGIDEGLWSRLPGLAPGQAIVSMTSMTRPLLVAIDPTPCKLRMVD